MSFPLTPVTAFDGLAIPDRSDPSSFPDRGDNWVAAEATAQGQFNVLAGQVNTMATSAQSSATSAASDAGLAQAAAVAATSAAGATAFNPATTYSAGQTAISNVNQQAYRRKTAGSSATDPANDPTNWTRVLTGLGGDGAAPSGSIVLTNASAGAQAITPTGYGQGATLPDATTCSKGAVLFTLRNKGNYPYYIKDSTGAVLGWVAPGGCAVVGLADNAAAAGAWNVSGVDPAAITAAASVGVDVGLCEIVQIDANRTFMLLHNGAAQLYGMVFDVSTATFGSPVLIRNVSNLYWYQACLSGANQLLVCTCPAGTAFEAVTLTLSGTAITVNTPATATLGSNMDTANTGGVIPLNGSFVMAYTRTSLGFLRAMTISGTAVTIGAELSVTPTSMRSVYAWSSTVGIVFGSNGTNQYAVPFTVSGTTVTLGTSASWANTQVIETTRVWGSRYLCLGNGTCALVSISGITASASTFAGGFASASFSDGSFADAQISATKWFAAEAGVNSYKIITDSAGTASITSFAAAAPGGVGGGADGWAVARVTSTRVLMYAVQRAVNYDGSTANYWYYTTLELDVSGATASEVRCTDWEVTIPQDQETTGGGSRYTNVITRPPISYCGLSPMANSGTQPSAPVRNRLGGSPRVMGVDASVSVLFGGMLAMRCDGSGMTPATIPSLNMMPASRSGNGTTLGRKRLSGIHINSRRLIGQGGNDSFQRAFYCVESIA